mgnify:CR=1 FL=1
MGLIAFGSDVFWRSYGTTPAEEPSWYNVPYFPPRYEPRFVSSMNDGTNATDVHRLFDCPNPVQYCDGSAAYCACDPPDPKAIPEESQLYYDRLRAAGCSTWREVTDTIKATFPPDWDEQTSHGLENVRFDEGTWFNPHPIVEMSLDPHLFPTEPASEDAIDVTDILTTRWLVLVAQCGALRGVVDPACYRGLRESGHVHSVDR